MRITFLSINFQSFYFAHISLYSLQCTSLAIADLLVLYTKTHTKSIFLDTQKTKIYFQAKGIFVLPSCLSADEMKMVMEKCRWEDLINWRIIYKLWQCTRQGDDKEMFKFRGENFNSIFPLETKSFRAISISLFKY